MTESGQKASPSDVAGLMSKPLRRHNQTALHVAAARQSPLLVALLAARMLPGGVAQADSSGLTALHYAAGGPCSLCSPGALFFATRAPVRRSSGRANTRYFRVFFGARARAGPELARRAGRHELRTVCAC